MPSPNQSEQTDAEKRHERNNIRQLVELAVAKQLAARDEKLTSYIDLKFQELHDTFLGAFPDSDPAGHKAYHVEQIEYMKEKRALYKDIRSKTVVGIVWMGVVLLGTALLDYAKRRLLAP